MAKNTKIKKEISKVGDKEEIYNDEQTPLKRYEELRKMEFIQVASTQTYIYIVRLYSRIPLG